MAVIRAPSTFPILVISDTDQALSLGGGGKPPLSGHIGFLSFRGWLWSEYADDVFRAAIYLNFKSECHWESFPSQLLLESKGPRVLWTLSILGWMMGIVSCTQESSS